jgi:hypothetical protein
MLQDLEARGPEGHPGPQNLFSADFSMSRDRRTNPGSFATLAAILLASSFVSNFAADRRPGSSS